MYSSVYYNKKTSNYHLWEYDEEGNRKHKKVSAPLYFYIENDDGDYKTLDGRKAKRIECDTWRQFKDKKDSYKSLGVETFESDIPPETKFIVERYKDQELTPPKFNIHFFDIEVHSEEGFPHPEQADYPITIITNWSTKHNKFIIFAEKDFGELKDPDSGEPITEEYEKYIFDTEEDLLRGFVKYIRNDNVDILSGWNSGGSGGGGFDIPYIINRIDKLLGFEWVKKLSPVNQVNIRESKRDDGGVTVHHEIVGIALLDLLEVYKNYTFSEKENYRLGYIAQQEIGATKIEYEGTIVDLYKDWQKYVEYNIQDVRLLRDLEDKLGYLNLLITFCYGCRVPFESFDRTTRVLDGAFVSELIKEKTVLPDINRELRNVSYPGGFVRDPIRGYHDWVVSYDATSLYPSIMMGWNISPETKVGVVNQRYISEARKGLMKLPYDEIETTCYARPEIFGEDVFVGSTTEVINALTETDSNGKWKLKKGVNAARGVHGAINHKFITEYKKAMVGKSYEDIEIELLGEDIFLSEFIKKVKDNNWCVAGNGAVYSQDKQGVIPRFVENWFNKRKEYKKKMLAEKDKIEECKTEEEKELVKMRSKIFDFLQLNYKILINSCYGYLGTVHSRFYDFDNCVAVCLNGQDMIQQSANNVRTYCKKKYNTEDVVTYGDTDSVYLNLSSVMKAKGIPNKTMNLDEIYEIVEEHFNEDKKDCLENEINIFIEKCCETWTMKVCNCNVNKIFFKREAVARSAIFLEPKKYVAWVQNDEGNKVDKLKTTGVEIVRSSTPAVVQDYMKDIVINILKTKDKKITDDIFRKARTEFMAAEPFDIAKPTSCNNYYKYMPKMEDGTFYRVPIGPKAGYIYNQEVKKHGLFNKYEEVFEGDKMKFVYMKIDATWKLPLMGMKDKWPDDFGITHLVDYETQFNKVFYSPMEAFYYQMGWQIPDFTLCDVEDLFS